MPAATIQAGNVVEPIEYTLRSRYGKRPCYRWLRKTDKLPTYDEIAEQVDPICRVKLFDPTSAWTWYVTAGTRYGDEIVLTSYVRSGLDVSLSEYGDGSLSEIAAIRGSRVPLPVERDLHFKPARLSEVKARIAEGRPL